MDPIPSLDPLKYALSGSHSAERNGHRNEEKGDIYQWPMQHQTYVQRQSCVQACEECPLSIRARHNVSPVSVLIYTTVEHFALWHQTRNPCLYTCTWADVTTYIYVQFLLVVFFKDEIWSKMDKKDVRKRWRKQKDVRKWWRKLASFYSRSVFQVRCLGAEN